MDTFRGKGAAIAVGTAIGLIRGASFGNTRAGSMLGVSVELAAKGRGEGDE